MTDEYAYWASGLEGQFGAFLENEPQYGFYKIKSGGGLFLPVAIWPDDGMTWAKVGNEDPKEADDYVRDVWMRCARYPVTEAAYRYAIKTSEWPGEAPAVPGPGHNRPPPEGMQGIADELGDQSKQMRAWLDGRKIVSADDSDRCETWANAFLKLKKLAEAEHKVEKAPYLKAGKVVDAKWKPLIDLATQCARALKDAATPYLLARQAEKQAAAAQALARGEPVPARTELRATTSGNSGRKLHLREHKWAEVMDWPAAVAFFEKDPEIRALVQRRADQLAEIGAPVPWAVFKSEQKAA